MCCVLRRSGYRWEAVKHDPVIATFTRWDGLLSSRQVEHRVQLPGGGGPLSDPTHAQDVDECHEGMKSRVRKSRAGHAGVEWHEGGSMVGPFGVRPHQLVCVGERTGQGPMPSRREDSCRGCTQYGRVDMANGVHQHLAECAVMLAEQV